MFVLLFMMTDLVADMNDKPLVSYHLVFMQKQEYYWLLVKCQMIWQSIENTAPFITTGAQFHINIVSSFATKGLYAFQILFLWRLQKSFLNHYVLLFRSILIPQYAAYLSNSRVCPSRPILWLIWMAITESTNWQSKIGDKTIILKSLCLFKHSYQKRALMNLRRTFCNVCFSPAANWPLPCEYI